VCHKFDDTKETNNLVRIMRKLVLVILIIIVGISCKEKTTYQLQILIKNKTNNPLTVKLFPKIEYRSGDLYDFSKIGGGHRNTEFQIESNLEMEIYITNNLTVEPYHLARQVFDSIHISTFNETLHEIKFSTLQVRGYSENLFSENSNWTFELRNFDLPTNFQRNPVESYDYIFEISQDKLTK
jgi:hypothetical protein